MRTALFWGVFEYCRHYWSTQRSRFVGIMSLILVASLLDAITPLLLGHLIDAISRGDIERSITTVQLILGGGALLFLCRCFSSLLLNHTTRRIMRSMIEDGFRRVQRLSTEWHSSSFGGATVRSITRGAWGYDVLADTLVLGFLPASSLLLAVVLLLSWHWPAMGVVVASGVTVYLVIVITLSSGYITPAARRSNAMDSKMNGALADAITCNAVVKSYAAEEREDKRLASVAAQWETLIATTWTRLTLTGFYQNTVSLMLQGGILIIGLRLWRQARATPGDIAYVLTTFGLIQGYLREFGIHFRNLLRSVGDMDELVQFARIPLGVEDAMSAKPLLGKTGRVVFDNVSFRYPGAQQSLYRHLSVEIPAGSKIGLVGASGSGKSTFVKLIQRMYDIEDGRILIDGQDIALVTQESLRNTIAVVQQEPLLFHRSVAENIAYGKAAATRAEIVEAARTAYAHDFITNLPQGYDTLVGERGIKLSGGERQRVALARAVLSEANILILDEASSSLDSVSEHLLQLAVERVTQKRTTIIIAHRLSTVRRVDRILLFDGGRIIEEGNHRQLLAKTCGHYRRLFDTQVSGLIDAKVESTANPRHFG